MYVIKMWSAEKKKLFAENYVEWLHKFFIDLIPSVHPFTKFPTSFFSHTQYLLSRWIELKNIFTKQKYIKKVPTYKNLDSAQI